MKRAFTIAELMVVITIIALVTALALPEAGQFIRQSQEQGIIDRLSSTLVTAQSTASAYNTLVAVRIERAYETDMSGEMVVNSNGVPRWDDHQQMQIMVAGMQPLPGKAMVQAYVFRPLPDSKLQSLPGGMWLAPEYALKASVDANVLVPPGHSVAAPVNPLDTFWIVFNSKGEVVRLPAEAISYIDPAQGDTVLTSVSDSVTSLVTYDRDKWSSSDDQTGILRRGLPLYISRFTGEVIKGQR